MTETSISEIVRANHELVKDSKIDFVIRLSTLPLSAAGLKVAIYLGVDKTNGHNGQCNPKVQTIAEETGLSRSAVEKAIRALRELGVITHIVKGKFTSWYYLAMPEIPAEVEAAREENKKKAKSQHPSKRTGSIRPNVRVSYEQGNRTREEEPASALATDNAFGGPSDFSSPIGKETVAGSSNPAQVDSSVDKEKGSDLYQPTKIAYPVPTTESDLSATMKRLVTEYGNSDEFYDICRKLIAGDLTEDAIRDRRAVA